MDRKDPTCLGRTPSKKKKKPKPMSFQQFLDEADPFELSPSPRARAATLGAGPSSARASNLPKDDDEISVNHEGEIGGGSENKEMLASNQQDGPAPISEAIQKDVSDSRDTPISQDAEASAAIAGNIEILKPVLEPSIDASLHKPHHGSEDRTKNGSANTSRVPSPSGSIDSVTTVIGVTQSEHFEAPRTSSEGLGAHTQSPTGRDSKDGTSTPIAIPEPQSSVITGTSNTVPTPKLVHLGLSGSQLVPVLLRMRDVAIPASTTRPSVDATVTCENVEAWVQKHADEHSPENIRPAPQNLRYGAYQGQQAPQSRNTPLGSGRLQNASKSGALCCSFDRNLGAIS